MHKTISETPADAQNTVDRAAAEGELMPAKQRSLVECFRPDHPFFAKFFSRVEELRLPTLIHTGDGFSSPGLALKVARKHPNMVMILGHLKEGCIGAMKESQDIYVETSGTLPRFVEMATHLDENRVLFGSDIPYYRFPTQAAIIEAADITSKTKRKVYSENFERLFKE